MNTQLLNRFLLISLLLIGLLLRLYGLTEGSFTLDESYSVLFSQGSWEKLASFARLDSNPYLSMFLLKAWVELFGTGELSYELFSVVPGVLLLLVAYLFAKKMFGNEEALILVSLLTFSKTSLLYSQYVRIYSWALLVLLLLAITLVDYLRSGSRASLIGLMFLSLLSINLHYVLLLVVSALYFAALFISKQAGRRRGLLVAGLVVGVLYLPTLWSLLQQYLYFDSFDWIRDPFINTLASGWHHFAAESTPALLILTSAAVIALRVDWRRKEVQLLAFWLLLPILLLFGLSLLGKMVFHVRYFVFSMPAFLLLAARGLSRFGPKLAVPVALVCIFLFIAKLPGYYSKLAESRAAKVQFTLVEQNFEPSDVILHGTRCSFFRSHAYFSQKLRDNSYLFERAIHSNASKYWFERDVKAYRLPVAKADRVWVFSSDCYPHPKQDAVLDIFESTHQLEPVDQSRELYLVTRAK